MFTDESAAVQLLTKIENFPLIKKYLTPSLEKRVQSANWYDNRVIVYILRNVQWVNRLEHTFSEAQFDTILNSEEIFGLLNGTEEDYDQQLFDAIAEVRLARWGRSQGYKDIVKLKRAKWPTPDFCMIGKGEIILAEARHFRPRDYVLDYIYDRLDGLALKTGHLAKFGLLAEAGTRYSQERDRLVGGDRLNFEKKYKDMVRVELSETFFYSLGQRLESDANAEVDVLEGLLTIKRGSLGSGIEINHSFCLGTIVTPELVLSKLCGELIKKLEQIQRFLDKTKHNATHVVVFFSGIDPSEAEWDTLWEALASNEPDSQWAWEYVDCIHNMANASIRIPFDLIVGRGNPVEYGSFPWKRNNL